jgi:DNA-directed RNA polymerase specialized sigma24 family protein
MSADTFAAVVLESARLRLSAYGDRYTRRNLDDLVQTAALESWRCRDKLRGNPEPWVARIAQRARARALRRHLRREGLRELAYLPTESLDTLPAAAGGPA